MGEVEEPCKFIQLSDCIMLELLSYLDATSLYFLSQTCTYFENIIKDRKLWKYVDARNKPNTEEKIDYCTERIHEDTTHLLLKADSRKGHLLFFDSVSEILSCRNLTVLSLENQRFCGKKICLQDFPSTLEELSLRKSHVRNGKAFFQHSFSSKSSLRVLILDECNWLDSSFIMSVSKFASLEIISIVKCNKLHYNIVPYLSVARQGCKILKVLDCRFSTVGNDFLRTFDENENILALYFQSMRSYQQDYDKPLLRNMEKVQNLNPDDMDLISQSIINNRSLYNYKFALGLDYNVEELPESRLYEYPYPPCICKYQENRENLEKEKETNSELHLSPLTWTLTKKLFGNEFYRTLCDQTGRTDLEDAENKNLMKVDDFMSFRSAAPQKFLCKRHSNEVENLPKEFKDFFVQNQLMFHAGHTDSDSDSDSDFDSDDCCMYGMGKAQQLILLRLNEIDSEGNLPEPEVIDLNAENRMEVEIIRIDPFGNSRNEAAVDRQRRSSNDEIIYHAPERNLADSTIDEKFNQNTSSTTTDGPSTSGNTPSANSSLDTPSTSHSTPFKSRENTLNISRPSTSQHTDSSSHHTSSSNKITFRTNEYLPSTSSTSIIISSTDQNKPSTSKDSSSSRTDNISANYSNSSAPSTSRTSTTGALSLNISGIQDFTECIDSDSKVTEGNQTECNKNDSGASQSVEHNESSSSVRQNISSNKNVINDGPTETNNLVSISSDESESLTERNDKQKKKGMKRSLPSADLSCQPSTSQAEYGNSYRKRFKFEKASGNVSISDDSKNQEGDDKLMEESTTPKEPTLPDSEINLLEVIPPNLVGPPNLVEAPNLVEPQNLADAPDFVADPHLERPVGFAAVFDRARRPNDDIINLQELFAPLIGRQEELKKKKLKLRRLSLRGYRKITDSALNYIRHLKIDLLDLTHTCVTKNGIEQFLSYNPNCRVIHKDFCVCKPRIPS